VKGKQMAKNYRAPGENITMLAPSGGVKSGEGRMWGALFGVGHYDAAEGAPVEVGVVGVWILPKVATVTTFAAGAIVFWNDSTKLCDLTGAGLFPIGIATAAAGATDTTVIVRLDGNSAVAA
jgi:predicted RecA/RadA family phage recombinase